MISASLAMWFFSRSSQKSAQRQRRNQNLNESFECVCFPRRLWQKQKNKEMEKIVKESWKSWAMIWRHLHQTELLVTNIRIESDSECIKWYFIPYVLSKSARVWHGKLLNQKKHIEYGHYFREEITAATILGWVAHIHSCFHQ